MVCSCWLYVLNSFPSPFFGSLFTFYFVLFCPALFDGPVLIRSLISLFLVFCVVLSWMEVCVCVEFGWTVCVCRERVFCIYNTFCHVWCVWIVGKRRNLTQGWGRGAREGFWEGSRKEVCRDRVCSVVVVCM